MCVYPCWRESQLSAARAILCRVGSSCRPKLGLWASDSKLLGVCVCVCETSPAAAGAFTNVKRLSVFVSSGPELMRTKLKIHCAASVCARARTKRGNKNRARAEQGSAKADSTPHPLLLLFSSFFPLFISGSLCLALAFFGLSK